MRRVRLFTPLALLVAVGLAVTTAPAHAHEERPAQFPDGTGHVPAFKGWDNPRHRVVCKRGSAARIAAMPAGPVKSRNRRLLKACTFRSIQTAINSIRRPGTSVYVLPGTYHERKWATQQRSTYCSHLATASKNPLPAAAYIGSVTAPDSPMNTDHAPGERSSNTGAKNAPQTNPIALSYADQRACPHNLNLIAIFGDRTPKDRSIHCNSRFCGTQVVGTGRRQTDVVIDNRFSKLNGIRADRVGGVYLKNFTVQQSEFNAVYVLETDGFVMDHLTTRGNDEYGILAFASDHGVIQHTDDYYNGDSGIYPGSGSDINGNNSSMKPIRYAIEIRYNNSHDNTLGYSGTAGNSIYAHHNDFHHNATGISTDSLFPGHPGLPQDHARWSYNVIRSNNVNWYAKYVDTGVCAKPMKDRGYLHGTVCPVVPVPVGTGLLIAGGNFDMTDHNWIYDNWRYGTMQFWVPAPLRDEYDPAKLYDTSHHDMTVHNRMGIAPDGSLHHNGMDHWWDDEGNGNCWQGNTYSRGHQTDNFVQPTTLCSTGGSVFEPGMPVKDAGFLSCSQYDRSDPTLRHPAGCTWFTSPSRPTGADPVPAPAQPAVAEAVSSGPAPYAAGMFLLLAAAVGVHRARRRS